MVISYANNFNRKYKLLQIRINIEDIGVLLENGKIRAKKIFVEKEIENV
jgi:hypothetical protein